MPKAQRTRGLSSYYRISIKHQLQNFNQTSASQLNLKLKSWPNLASEYWPRFNFVTSSKHQRQNADQTSASKSRQNFNFKKSWPKCSKSEQKLSFITKPQLPNLQLTVANSLLQNWKPKFAHKVKFLFLLWAQGLVKFFKLKFRQDFEAEVWLVFCRWCFL